MFTISIEKVVSNYANIHLDVDAEQKVIESRSFETRAIAKKAVKILAKKHFMTKHGFTYCNHKENTEMVCNF